LGEQGRRNGSDQETGDTKGASGNCLRSHFVFKD
jgi:hypothetical protein